jgi:uncharacterized protein (DUF433 family)
MAVETHPFVSEVPGVNGGYPVVRGTRTPVRVIVKYYRETRDLAQVQDALGHLSSQQLAGALDYYQQHPARVDEDIARNDQAWAELQGDPSRG